MMEHQAETLIVCRSAAATLAELAETIDRLPPPANGMRRVYRGQAQDYGTLIPTARRPSICNHWPIDWKICGRQLAGDLRDKAGKGDGPNRFASLEEWQFWSEADARRGRMARSSGT